MKWLRRWLRGGNGAAVARARAEAKLDAARKMTPAVERMAHRVAELPADEFADRVARAFRRRPA